MIEAFFSNPYSVLGAILLASFGGYIVWRNNYKTRVATASAAFRGVFLFELGSVYPTVTNWPKNGDAFFKARFISLQTAVETFRPFVSWRRRRKFDFAWLCYYSAYPQQI